MASKEVYSQDTARIPIYIGNVSAAAKRKRINKNRVVTTKKDFDLTLENLDKIFTYTTTSEFNNERINFDVLSDETQYIANRFFTEIMKKDLCDHYSVTSEFNGYLDPILDIYNVPGVETIHNKYGQLASKIAPLYVSKLIQQQYEKTDDINNFSPDDRRAFNSWDMIKANSDYGTTEHSKEFKSMMAELYNLAIDYTETVYGGDYLAGSCLKAYKDNNGILHWGKQLYDHYCDVIRVQNILDENTINNQDNKYDVAEKLAQVQNIFSKLRCLSFTDDSISDEEINDLEGQYFGVLILGMAYSIKIGNRNDENSLRNNRKLHIDTMNELLKEGSIVKEFWENFIETYGNGSVEIAHEMISESNSTDSMAATGSEFINRLKDDYLIFNSRGLAGETALFQFLLGIALGHFIFSTFEDQNNAINISEAIGLSSAITDAGKGILYLVLVTKIKKYFLGKLSGVADSGSPFARAAKFYLNFLRGFKLTKNAETKIITSIFMKSKIAAVVERVSLVFGVVALGVAAYNFAEAIMEGNLDVIIFEAFNTLIALSGVIVGVLALAGVAWAGPVGLAIAIIGAIVAIAQWLYEILNPEPPPLSPIQKYTRDVVQDNGFQFSSNRYFISTRKGNHSAGNLFQAHVNELLWEEGAHNTIALVDYIAYDSAVCDYRDKLCIYDYHATKNNPQYVNLDLSGPIRDLYVDWIHRVSDKITSIQCVVISNDYAYGLCAQEDYQKDMYRWLAGKDPPTHYDKLKLEEHHIEWVCKVENRVFALSFHKIYEIIDTKSVEILEFLDKEANVSRLSACVTENFIYISMKIRAEDHGSEVYSSMIEITVTDSSLYSRNVFTHATRISDNTYRQSTVVYTEEQKRKVFITYHHDKIQRQGILIKDRVAKIDKSIDLVDGVTFPESDGSWNDSYILCNVRVQP
ncbi:hypothetical protein LOD99_1054 [Oopsacas minuta]|uniref:Uncharacterized protein n=1 Tax=Oopsacas minuta TaxID=111878 RepID=A0AAV7K0P7_9METZ|nr:hypothetical protein LOD99_1054 [Oopsacas minuta]